jgi:argininosuccinate lyase
MQEAARRGYATATDLADYLVRSGMPFRDAHEAVGRTVQYALAGKRELADLSLPELKRFCPNIGRDVRKYLELKGSVDARDHTGGTAPRQVRAAARKALKYLENIQSRGRVSGRT